MLGLFYIAQDHNLVYNLGNQFIGWFLLNFLYVGAIILIYGNIVSAGIACLHRKWFPNLDWLHILILGVFGLGNGLFFQEWFMAYCGMAAAVLYGIIDKWLNKRNRENKTRRAFILLPIGCLIITWGLLQLSSPSLPPFTKQDAVDNVIEDESTVFPQEIGKRTREFEGYHVVRETEAEEIRDEVYIVRFSEHWRKGSNQGTWSTAYKVNRNSLTTKGSTGVLPPYYGSSNEK
ncbi:hypothetical protein [Thalassobacillus sp. CUG 92003]|uniref:hypothetical protein n=1 Tax=Thalassobacillus sp. CUG 92003 TaxID=2736641 RepID=UPI0015E62C15|nr:hypothetical protein [Thalassobacillus sp. CUG 92003]